MVDLFKSPDQDTREDEHKEYYSTSAATFKSRWAPHGTTGTTKGSRESKVQTQESTIFPLDEGLPLKSGSDDKGGAAAPAAAAEPAGHSCVGQ